jgi:hypothetical protein
MTKSGSYPSALTWPMAPSNDAVTSVFAGPVNPMWLSESWTKRRPPSVGEVTVEPPAT